MLNRRNFVGSVATGSLAAVGATASGVFARPAFASYAADSELSSKSTDVEGILPYATPSTSLASQRAASPKRLLVVVDYQVDFVDGGTSGTVEPALAIEDALCERIQEYYDRGDIVIYTMDTHPQDNYKQTREGQVNPPHCIPGQPGWEIYGKARDLLTTEKAIRVMKGTYGSPDLPFVVQNILSQGIRLEYIEMAGVSTTCRVLHNAIMLYNFFPELPIIFDQATTASYTDERTIDQLDELESWGFIVRWSQA